MVAEPTEILKKYWGYDAFRPLQPEIIHSVLEGHHTLALLPTGGGKSICFQVPALCLPGVCIVISPLIALMKDQVEQLKLRNIKAAALYSGMSLREMDITLDNCIYGDIRFLYVSPERIKTALFLERARQMTISLVAVDEAHCISQWGYDFRPPYLEIATFLKEVTASRIIALTASATREVKEDILARLEMDEPRVFQKSFARPNLSYSVFCLENKEQKMLEILQNVPGSSVIYVRSRKLTKEVSGYLNRHQIDADYYHAGLSGEQRSRKQENWIQGQVRVIVATNAFGMGIDKPDVRTVIHLDLPDSLEAYYQEAGRGGRDEKRAYAVQLYSEDDLQNLLRRVQQATVSTAFILQVYQALANFYKLAVGSSAYSSFEFDYSQFTRTFDLPSVETFHALNKLSEEGLIQISESFREPSRIIFLLSQEEVYKYQVANKSMDAVLKVMMRLYGGELFTNYVNVKEKEIAAMLKEPKDVAIKQLEFLNQNEIIEYHHYSERPRITFLTPRFDSNNLPLDKTRLEWRRKVTLDKAAAVQDYVQNELKCRTRILQNYFDEISFKDCGACDICLARNKRTQTIPLANILEFIKENPRTENELINQFSKLSQDTLVTAIRLLLDQGKITFTLDDKFKLLP